MNLRIAKKVFLAALGADGRDRPVPTFRWVRAANRVAVHRLSWHGPLGWRQTPAEWAREGHSLRHPNDRTAERVA